MAQSGKNCKQYRTIRKKDTAVILFTGFSSLFISIERLKCAINVQVHSKQPAQIVKSSFISL